MHRHKGDVLIWDNPTIKGLVNRHLKKETTINKKALSNTTMLEKIQKTIGKLGGKKEIKFNNMKISKKQIEYEGQILKLDGKSNADWVKTIFGQICNVVRDPNNINWDNVFAALISMIRSTEDNLISGKIGDVTFTYEKKTTTSTKGVVATRHYINDHRINKVELTRCLERALCYETQKDFDYFLNAVSKCSLEMHGYLHDGVQTNVSDFFQGYNLRYHVKFPIERKGRSTYLILDKEEYRVRNFARFKAVINKNTVLEVVEVLLNEAIVEGVDLNNVKIIIESAKKEYDTALKKSQELLDETVKLFKLEEEQKRVDDGLLSGYKIEGKIRNYFVEKGNLVPDKNNHRDCRIYDYETGKYICIIDKSSAGDQVGMDRLVGRIYALHNDNLVAREVHTLNNG